MKNLKKVLALVLVVATLMSFATVASAKYTDDSSINYDEAVAVMSEIGVINGYTDNSFRPTANVTRAQMAKMVAYIVAGGEDVGALYAGANSFSDCTTHWAKGYIAYANKTGIVAGVGGGKFNPDGSVTGTQAAKMMLCALGYDSDAEGYTGTNWAVNVLSDARDAGLLKDLENVNMSVAMTREQAAQLMFNALKADMVEYDRGNISIENGDTSIIIGGSAAKKVANTSSDYTKANGKWDKDDSDSVMQLCEKYFPKLNVTATKADAFGAAAHAWKYDKGDELVFADEPILTYTAAVTGKDLFSDVKNAGYKMEATGKADTATINVYRNNTVSNTETVTNSSAKSYGGNGIELNVYAGTDDVIYVTAKVTYLAEITGIAKDKTNTSADERSLSVKYKDANNNEVNTVKLNADTTGFDAIYDGAKVGDKLLITPKGDNTSATTALTVSSVKSETGKITAVNSSANTITFNGTKYELAGVSKASNYTVSKDDVTVYFDANGYVIGSTSIASSGDKSLVVMKAFQGLDADGALVPKANVVFSDGTVQTIQLNAEYKGATPVVKTYTEKDGVYTLDEVTTTAADGAVMAFNSNKTTLAADGKKLTLKDGASGSTYYFTSDVKFISVKDGKATTYDGVQKFSNLDGAAVLTKVGDNDYQISTVYILGSTDTASTTSDELIYVKGGKTGTVLIEDANESSGYKTYYTYDAYINGEKVDGFYATTDTASAGFYKNEKTDAGAYVLTGNEYSDKNVVTGVAFSKLINGTILNAGNVDYDVANAVVTDLTDNDITSAVDIDNAASENNVTLAMVFDKDTKTVDYIYVTGVSAK